MPIRPIDMQVSVPKLSEASRMSHLDQQKAGLHQNQGAISNNKNNNKENRSVVQTHKDGKSGSEADARKEGRNKYVANRSSKTQEDQKEEQRPKSINKIDIRI